MRVELSEELRQELIEALDGGKSLGNVTIVPAQNTNPRNWLIIGFLVGMLVGIAIQYYFA